MEGSKLHIVQSISEVPDYVKKKPKFYQLKEVRIEGKPVFTKDYERAIAKPNFEDHSQIIFEEDPEQKEYGNWSHAIDGIAPRDLVEHKAAMQLKDRVDYYYSRKDYPANAVNLRMHYVEPIHPNLEVFYCDKIEDVPQGARAYARQHMMEAPQDDAGEIMIKTAFPSQEKITDFAKKTGITRLHGFEIEEQYEWTVGVRYPYSRVYDYEIHTPQYVKRSVKAKRNRIVHELYSFRYDRFEYHWLEEE